MEQELKDLKSVLRSLVVSSPTQMDVRSLLRDYRNMMGSAVPISKYGYRDPMQFLRERCNDCFVFQGPSSNPILTLIVPESLKHIDQFVQRQKVPSTVKFKGKRRSIPEQVMKQKDLVVNTFIPRDGEVKKSYDRLPVVNKKPVVANFVPRAVEINKSNINKIDSVNNTNQKPAVKISKSSENNNIESNKTNRCSLMSSKTLPNLNVDSKDEATDELPNQGKADKQENASGNTCTTETYSQNALHNFLKKRMPMYNSSHNIESEMSYDGKVSSKGDDDSGRQTSSSNSSTKAALLEELKIEIRDLIADYPEGVWCTDLIGLYRQRYNRELNFARFGYTSIISLVCMLEDVVRISRPVDTGNWLLTDARRQPAVERPRRFLPVTRAAADARADPDDALPGIDFDPDVFPPDCLHFMESIPAAQLSALGPGAMLEVMVGEVYSASHFWLLRLGSDHNIAMEDIMDEMTEYYTFGEGRNRSLALGAVRVGHYCSSVYERDWHRSLIVRLVDSDTVKVRHVDYGTVETVRVSALKPLRRQWALLPAQALRARLAAVRPPAAGRRWPHASSAHFLHRVRDRRLVANVVAVDKEEDILEVFLIDTSTEEDVCLSADMIRSGHADPRSDSALLTMECYLFPRFDVLESGATPNYGEIHAYLRDGIALDYVDEYRLHVPACLPPATPSPPAPPEPSISPTPSPSTSPAPPSDTSNDTGCDADDDSHEAPRTPPPAPLTRSASTPGCASPEPPPAPPARFASEHVNVARLEVMNRIPLRPERSPSPRRRSPPRQPSTETTQAPPAPRPPPPPRFLPPVRTAVPHSYPPMMPVPGYAGFPPFPGAMPLYPPMFPAPPMMMSPQFPGAYCPPPPRPYAAAPRPPRPAPPPPAETPRPASPPPPYNGGGRANGEVTLSVSECEIFKLLSKVDANAAHWYMVDAISRAMGAGGAVSSLAAGTQTDSPHRRLPPGMRPPPGFGG